VTRPTHGTENGDGHAGQPAMADLQLPAMLIEVFCFVYRSRKDSCLYLASGESR
jgi:hypothetical protein